MAAPPEMTSVSIAASPSNDSDVTQLLRWIKANGDNHGSPFIIVDKRRARIFAFDKTGVRVGESPALLGAALGDVNPPGIGDRPLSKIGPQDRITAAGRYVAQLGNDLGTRDILWVDYSAGLSLHRVIAGRPADRRVHRLMSEGIDDNRISYGCINVLAHFFDTVLSPLFAATTGIVYILPEHRSLRSVFPM